LLAGAVKQHFIMEPEKAISESLRLKKLACLLPEQRYAGWTEWCGLFAKRYRIRICFPDRITTI